MAGAGRDLLADANEARAAFPEALAEAKESPDQLQQLEPLLRALVALANQQPAEAVQLLEPITYDRRFAQHVTTGRWRIAGWDVMTRPCPALSWLAGPPPQMGLDASVPFVLHELAEAQAATGQTAAAGETRGRLAALWKNADDDVPLMRRR